jgi:hypothetical protein
MAIEGITFNVPVSLIFDDAKTTSEDSIRDFYRMLEEAEQAGFTQRNLIHIGFSEPFDHTLFTPQSHDPEAEGDDLPAHHWQCEECQHTITDGGVISADHAESCSAHPCNVAGSSPNDAAVEDPPVVSRDE